MTVALAALLAWEPVASGALTAIYASIVDPVAVKAAAEAGVGNPVSVEIGGKIDSRGPGPLSVDCQVLAVEKVERGGLSAVLGCGGASIVLSSERAQYAELGQYLDLGLDPRTADVVVVKIGYLEPDLYDIQADWMMALTPGGVDQDLIRLGHKRIDRPMVPFDQLNTDHQIQVQLTS